MIELKRLKLINWHNFENVTFDCARLTYMIGVNAVGKTTILDAIRYCLTTNRSFNALGNKKSGRTLQGSVHAKQRGENAYRRPGNAPICFMAWPLKMSQRRSAARGPPASLLSS